MARAATLLAAERRRGPEAEWAPRQLLRYVPSPLAAPGERWNYSNTNYLLLGLVVERATHRRIGPQLPKTFVFQPPERPAGDVAVGYLEGRPSRKRPLRPSREAASSACAWGNLLASAGHLARVDDALLRAPPRDDAVGEGVRRPPGVRARTHAHSPRRPRRLGPQRRHLRASTPTTGTCRRPI